jgi:hypothetical protein
MAMYATTMPPRQSTADPDTPRGNVSEYGRSRDVEIESSLGVTTFTNMREGSVRSGCSQRHAHERQLLTFCMQDEGRLACGGSALRALALMMDRGRSTTNKGQTASKDIILALGIF